MSSKSNRDQKITPYLWFDRQAERAAQLYVDVFEAVPGQASQIVTITRYDGPAAEMAGLPEGSVMTVGFQLAGHEFVALNGGPEFSFTPAVSFFVSLPTEAAVDHFWHTLSREGQVLMPLDTYPFSQKFGWLNDRFGVSWQVSLAEAEPSITPSLLFVGSQQGRAEEAINLYCSLFDDSGVVSLDRYVDGDPEPAGTLRLGRFRLAGQPFMAMDSALDHKFTFTEAVSFLVNCRDQAEVDRLWAALTADGEESMCGWLKDKFGVSWQIVPGALFDMLNDPNPARAERVTRAMLEMKKIDLPALERAYTA